MPLATERKRLSSKESWQADHRNPFRGGNPRCTRTNMKAFVLEFRLIWCQAGNQMEDGLAGCLGMLRDSELTGFLEVQEKLQLSGMST